MKDRRKGNDINVAWKIMKDDDPFSLTGKDVRIYLKTPFGKREVKDFSVAGNTISWTFYGKDQNHLGKHSLELVINENEVGMISTDYCDFVNLVSCSCMVGGSDEGNITTESIELTTTLEFVAGEGGGSYDDTEIRNELAELSAKIDNINPTPMVSVTYAELVELRDNGELVAGKRYRITDYITTTIQENTRSAGNPFDVIVLALSENTIAEEASAIQSKRDIDGYFANSNISAWKIWYSLDNDANRYAWADSENGKGVIYRMIDEWNNDVPYDFKNILFRRKIILNEGFPQFSEEAEEYWVYTFAATSYHINNDEWSDLKDGSLESPNGHQSDEDTSTFHHNTIKSWFLYFSENEAYQECGKAYLNDNVFLGYWEEVGSANEDDLPYYYAYCCFSNSFGINCHSNSFGIRSNCNKFGDGCEGNGFGKSCSNNSFDSRCSNNIFGENCNLNVFGGSCILNVFGDGCGYNVFGDGCYNNVFGDSCDDNVFGNGCNFNSFGINCNSNSFGNNCSSNSFGNSSQQDDVKAYYRYITLGEGVQYVTFQTGSGGSYNNQVQNYRVANGTCGTHLKQFVINLERNKSYETFIGMDSKDELKMFCLADFDNKIADSISTTLNTEV